MKIAVLDVDVSQAKLICDTLTRESHECHAFTSCTELVEQFQREPYDLLVVSLNDGETDSNIVQEIRKQVPSAVPILCITGTHDEDRILASLHAGANDYLVRPVRRWDLATRTSVLLRQAYPSQATGEQLRFGVYLFEPGRYRLTIAGKPVSITKKEFELGLLLFRNLGRPLSRATIVEKIWSGTPPDLSRTMDTHMSRVRHKLGLDPERGYRLAPVYGFGYRLDEIESADGGSQQSERP